MAFGKRTNGPGLAHAMPPSMWTEPPDALLANEPVAAPRKPATESNDASSRLRDAVFLRARLERDRAAHEAKLDGINRFVAERTDGGSVRAFSLIPDSCWRGEFTGLLTMRLGLSPYEDWNMIFLPADQRTAERLEMPVCPDSEISAFVAVAGKSLREADTRLRDAQYEAARTGDLEAFAEAKDDIRDDVRAIATHFLNLMDLAWAQRHPG